MTFWEIFKLDFKAAVSIVLGYMDVHIFRVLQLALLTIRGKLNLIAIVSYAIVFESFFFVPLAWAFADMISAKISSPIAERDGKKL